MNYKIFIIILLSLLAIACTEISNSFQSQKNIDRFQIQNGLAIDSTNGLMWTRCLLGTIWNGTMCEGKPTVYSWQEIQQAVKSIKYAGYSDWRVPILNELKILADTETGAASVRIPHLNQTVFPIANCHGTQASLNNDGHICWHWTSTPIETSNHHAWIVYFGYGYSSGNYKADTFALRLVRNYS